MLPHPKEEEEEEEAMFHGDLCNNTLKTKPIVIERVITYSFLAQIGHLFVA